MTLRRTIPAMPVRDLAAAVAFYRVHAVSYDGVDDTDFGTRELATLDLDGNLVTFFERADE